MEFRNYRKKGVQPMRPYVPGEELPDGISISDADRANGSPREGDMIAVNPNDPTDHWLVAKVYFLENYEEA